MKTELKLSSLQVKPIKIVEIEDTRWKLNWEKKGIENSILKLLTDKDSKIIYIDKQIWAIQISNWKNTLSASNDPEAPWILKLNNEISLTSSKLTKHIWLILDSIH